MDNHSFEHRAKHLIQRLKQLDCDEFYETEESIQVMFTLKNGKSLRIGFKKNPPSLWCDQFLPPGIAA